MRLFSNSTCTSTNRGRAESGSPYAQMGFYHQASGMCFIVEGCTLLADDPATGTLDALLAPAESYNFFNFIYLFFLKGGSDY